ncbi:glycerol dehydrogenase [Celerinatantimonas yamalensis]|uniref:Glycerol dehydrogenase n=1 Tax=Celerinatantimonas yamalensis TaxID=559956 RepID=A0ABW9GAC6_9GAMM
MTDLAPVRTVTSPKRFVIGSDLLMKLHEHMLDLGNHALFICDEFIVERIHDEVLPALKSHQLNGVAVKFNYECTQQEIDRLSGLSKTNHCNVIVGIGGGKTLDSAKATANQLKLPVVIIPTLAATDAPCTALAVLYKENGEFDRYLFLPQNPDLVIADLAIITAAPKRFFSAGIGDALATYFEARACYQSDGVNLVLKRPSRTGLGLAKMCYEILCENAANAIEAVNQHLITPALEQTIEATIYLSGVGAESGGLAASHAVSNGLTAVPDLHHSQHGEKVGFGLMTQLVLENAPDNEWQQVLSIMFNAQLPMTMQALGMKEFDETQWRQVAKIACDKNDTMGNMPMRVSEDDVYYAMLAADAIGKRYLAQHAAQPI